MKQKALAVMYKPPVAGRVKTRLTPPLTPEEAAGLYRAVLADVFAGASRVEGVELYAAATPAEDDEEKTEDPADDPVPGGFTRFTQAGEDLGERILSVFNRLFTGGHGRVVVIGSDSPDLPREYIEDAFGRLEEGGPETVVFGPAEDGGYYLVGMNTLQDAPFRDVPWSTPMVLEATLEGARGAGLSVELLDPWYDVDTPEDLGRLRGNPAAPESAAFVDALGI